MSPPALDTLLAELQVMEQAKDLDGLRKVREQIVLSYPYAEQAAEAGYKVGLDQLFRQRSLERAVLSFAQAASMRHPYWSAAARTSLGLCYYHQRKMQQGIFELRKVGYAKTPSMHSVTALAFLETIFQGQKQAEEVQRIRKDKINQLELLSQQAGVSLQHKGHYLLQLGLSYHDQGEVEQASAALQKAKALGQEALGGHMYRSIIEALRQLPSAKAGG